MRSTFFGIETARRALWANMRAMDVAAHNVANADTPGYSRQVAILKPTTPHSPSAPRNVVAGEVGTGVWVHSIQNQRVAFLDRQVGNALGNLEGWSVRRQVYEQIEVILQEPSESGLSAAFDRWFEALAILVANPEGIEARTLVLERAQTLVATFQSMDGQLQSIETELADNLEYQVNYLNELARQVDAINRRIVAAEASGSWANDLRDERANLIEAISRLVDVRVHETEAGLLRVSVGGVDLVGEGGARSIAIKVDSDGNRYLEWNMPASQVRLNGGGLKEILNLLNNVVTGYRNDLRILAKTLSDEVNAIHEDGVDLNGDAAGRPFFTGLDNDDDPLGTWSVNPELIADPSKVAAASQESGAPGNGDNIQRIVDLKSRIFNNEPFRGSTLDGFYRAWVAAIGAASQEAQQMERNQELLLAQLEAHRQQVSGVSIDEEMANILMYRQAYNAAARVLTVVDEMLDVLITGTGLVGR